MKSCFDTAVLNGFKIDKYDGTDTIENDSVTFPKLRAAWPGMGIIGRFPCLAHLCGY